MDFPRTLKFIYYFICIMYYLDFAFTNQSTQN